VIIISFAIYDLLLERAESFQKKLNDNGENLYNYQLSKIKMCTFGLVVQLFVQYCTCLHYQQICRGQTLSRNNNFTSNANEG